MKLVLLGDYDPKANPYHREIYKAAGDEVIFLGAIYDKPLLNSLRFYSRLYIHGHTVGGTNPSLVEAMAAGMPVLAHDNKFNRWVAGDVAHYFRDEDQCAAEFSSLLENNNELINMKLESKKRFLAKFTWDKILGDYEALLVSWNEIIKTRSRRNIMS